MVLVVFLAEVEVELSAAMALLLAAIATARLAILISCFSVKLKRGKYSAREPQVQ